MYPRFNLTLSITHDCNLRCSYCYTGKKHNRAMPLEIGQVAIDRAVASVARGGTLELGFFGGEPLLEAKRVLALIDHARTRSPFGDIALTLTLTTNGTVTGPVAWSIMTMPDLELFVSHDGLPAVHDRHRTTAAGTGTSDRVLGTVRRLIEVGKDFGVVIVVRPDTLEGLPDGIEFLFDLGVKRVEPSLDLWTRWTPEDLARLHDAVSRCATLWRAHLPDRGIGWFDEKAARLAPTATNCWQRCGFGDGEIAVAPSGRLYPCERLIGADRSDSRMALPGNVLDGGDFLGVNRSPKRADPACARCAMQAECNTSCRCSNFVRTGDIARPDGLLCTWNQACLNETATVLSERIPIEVESHH